MSQLPDKPSELIRVALADLNKVERSKKYVVDMGDWHLPDDGVCYVCLAGAVMAKTLGVSPKREMEPWQTKYDQKLQAIDSFREGSIHNGLGHMGLSRDSIGKYRDVAPYDADPKAFKKDMRKLASDLAKAGL